MPVPPASRSAPARAGESWAGQLVVYTKPAEQVAFGDYVDGVWAPRPLHGALPITVREELAGRVRVADGRGFGWAMKDDFVLLRDARDYFTARLAADPADPFARHMRGVAAAGEGDSDAAVADYDECLRRDPADVSALHARAVALARAGDLGRALSDADLAARLDPAFAAALVTRGDIRAAQGDYPGAIADYDAAIRLDPADPAAYLGRGVAWLRHGDPVRAGCDLDAAVRLAPTDPAAYEHRGHAWLARGGYDWAVNDFDQCLRLAPDTVAAVVNRGYAWAMQKGYRWAVINYAAALKLDPDNAAALNLAAWLRATCPDAKWRDGKQAVKMATRACELTGWEEPGYVDTLAAAHAEAGDFGTAARFQRQALADPGFDRDHGPGGRARLKLYGVCAEYREG